MLLLCSGHPHKFVPPIENKRTQLHCVSSPGLLWKVAQVDVCSATGPDLGVGIVGSCPGVFTIRESPQHGENWRLSGFTYCKYSIHYFSYLYCDAPNASEELPMPMASSLRPPTLPAAQVRQYSWHSCAKKDVYDIRREFVDANKPSNRVSSFLSQQAPLVSKVHLLNVIRKVGNSERSKGKHLEDFVFKGLPKSREKNLTSLSPSRQKSEGEIQRYSVIRECSNSEMNPFDHVSQHTNNIYTLKISKTSKEEAEVKSRHLGSTNGDVIVSNVRVTEPDSDVISRDVEVNKPVARKRYAQNKHSLVSKKGFLKSTLSMCSQTFTKVALMLAIVISVLGGGLNVKLPGRICTSGLESSVCQECESSNNSNSARPPFLTILRESAAAIVDLGKELCSRISKVMFLTDNKQLTGSRKILQNMIKRGVTIFSSLSQSEPRITLRCHGYVMLFLPTFVRNVLAGKCFGTYISPSADFWASRVHYLDTYTVNLESDNNFTVFHDLVYILYIYIIVTVRGHPVTGQHTRGLF